MKKIIYFVAGALITISATAFAANMAFTDQAEFDEWFEDAILNMNQKGIITGYSDGSFGPYNQVSRAELAVILDRYDTYIDNKINNTVKLSEIDDVINSTLRYADQEYTYYLKFVVLAESGLFRLDGPPESYDSSDWKKVEEATLPEWYNLYYADLDSTTYDTTVPYYLHYDLHNDNKSDCLGDLCMDNIWYGPFYQSWSPSEQNI